MTEQDIQRLKENGFDTEGAMRRFLNNADLYQKCLDKLPQDKCYENLKQALIMGDCEAAFRAAHTMKGFVANLGMVQLYDAVYAVVEKLRLSNMEVAEEMRLLDTIYEKDCQLIKEL